MLLVVTLLLLGGSHSETNPRRVFKEMVQWLNSPTEEILEGLATQEKASVAKEEIHPEGLATQEKASVAKEEIHPQETKLQSHKEYKKKKLKSEEYEKGGHSDAQEGHENSIGHQLTHEGSKAKNYKSGHHNKKGKDLKEHKHKDKHSKAEESDSKGQKGHSIKSKGHTHKGENEEGHQKVWHKEDSGRQKKFFDSAEEIQYSSEHDHFLDHHKKESKGGFNKKAKEESHLRDNHGKKYYKHKEGNFDKVHNEKESHGHREDYGDKKDFSRKGAHEGSLKSSKGNSKDIDNDIKGSHSVPKSSKKNFKDTDYDIKGSHSVPRPVKISDGMKIDTKPKVDLDLEDPAKTSNSSNIPLATVLEHAGYAQITIKVPSKSVKNVTPQSQSAPNKREVRQRARLIPIKNGTKSENKPSHADIKDKFSKIRKLRNKSRREPTDKKNVRNRLTNDSKIKYKKETFSDNFKESSKHNEVLQRDEPFKRIRPIVNRRLRKKLKLNSTDSGELATNENKNKKNLLPIKAKKRTRPIPHKRINLTSTDASNIKSKPNNSSSPISLFVLKNKHSKQKVQPTKILKGQHAGHKKHHSLKNSKKHRKTAQEETNEINDSKSKGERLHSSEKKPVIISDPFLTHKEEKEKRNKEKNQHSKKKFSEDSNDRIEPQDSNRIIIKPLTKKISKDFVEKVEKPKHKKNLNKTHKIETSKNISEDDKNAQNSKIKIVIKPLRKEKSQESFKHVEKTSKKSKVKPLKKDKSQQVSVVSTEHLKPSSTHKEHHKDDKPKKHSTFNSFDKGHHKEAGEKVEKGGFEEKGFKGNSERDHGKLHDSKFIDKGKKAEKGHNHEKHYEGHFDKGQKGSKGHAHGKKSHSHKGHSDKGFKNVHHKMEYAKKNNYYHDDELKKSHNVFDDFDTYFEKKRQENLKALNYHDGDHKKKYGYNDYHFDDNFHNHHSKHNKKYGHDGYHGNYNHHGYKSHKHGKHGHHHHHKGYRPHYDHKGAYSYNDYDYNYY